MTKEDLKKLIDAGYVTVTFLMDSKELADLEPADLVKRGYITDVAKGSEIISKAAEDDKKDPEDPGEEPGGEEPGGEEPGGEEPGGEEPGEPESEEGIVVDEE